MRAISLLALLFAATSSSPAAATPFERRSAEQTGSEPSATVENIVATTTAEADTRQDVGVDSQDSYKVEGTTASTLPTGDCAIMNFALTLEHLESKFYDESLAWLGQEDFKRAHIPNAARVYQNFVHIAGHERQHVKTLQRVISSFCGTPLPPCKYNFGVNDVHSFLAVARLLEKVGVSAYDGALALISNADVQTAAATIATIEGRHASWINSASGFDPFPQDFEVPLAGPAIVTMAASVIESCPFDIPSTLGAAPFKSLTLVSPSIVRSGKNIQLAYEGYESSSGHFCSFLFSDKSVSVPLDPECGCKVPRGARGDIFVAVTRSEELLTLKNTQDLIVAGPIVINVDTAVKDGCKDFVHGSPPSGPSHNKGLVPEEAHSGKPGPSAAVVYVANYDDSKTDTSTDLHQGSNYAGIPVHQTMPEMVAPAKYYMPSGYETGSEQVPVIPSGNDVGTSADVTAVTATSSDLDAQSTDGPYVDQPIASPVAESQPTVDASTDSPSVSDQIQTNADLATVDQPEPSPAEVPTAAADASEASSTITDAASEDSVPAWNTPADHTVTAPSSGETDVALAVADAMHAGHSGEETTMHYVKRALLLEEPGPLDDEEEDDADGGATVAASSHQANEVGVEGKDSGLSDTTAVQDDEEEGVEDGGAQGGAPDDGNADDNEATINEFGGEEDEI